MDRSRFFRGRNVPAHTLTRIEFSPEWGTELYMNELPSSTAGFSSIRSDNGNPAYYSDYEGIVIATNDAGRVSTIAFYPPTRMYNLLCPPRSDL